MKKIFVLSALSCACAGAFAQAPGVSVYGLLDVGVEYVTGVGANGSSFTRVPSATSSAPSRLGFRGSEKIGSDLTAFFTLEQGISVDTGTLGQGGRGFGRQALVGLSGPFGSFSFGRLYTMTFWSGLNADIHGGGIYGTGSLDSYLPNARADNAVGWRGKFGGLDLGATYSFGRDGVNAGPSPVGTNCGGELANDSKACREWSVMAKYDTPSWGVAIANDRMHGRTLGAAPDAIFGGLNSADKVDSRLIINGWAKVGTVTLGGGVIDRSNDGLAARPDSKLWHVGARLALPAALTLSGQVVTLRYKGASAANATVSSVRLTHDLSKRTAIFAQVGRISNGGSSAVALSGGSPGSNPVAGASQTGLNAGMRHSF